MEIVEHAFDPVFDERSTRLVLGTMPSPASRRYGFYYSHPQNRFWPAMAAIYGVPVPGTPEEKRKLALQHGIALWDVLARCKIRAAADHTISDPVPNDLSIILDNAPIRRIFTTGKRAAALYRKFCEPHTGMQAVELPSTSPANRSRFPLDKLIEVYRTLKEG